jgi:hypothetical protein
MVVMLIDQVAQHLAALLLETLATQAAATPGNFLPSEQAEFVTEFEHERSLLIVAKPNKVRAHVLHRLEGFPHDVIRHGGGDSSVIFMIVRAAKQEPLAIELDRAALDPLDRAHAEARVHRLLAIFGFQSNLAIVESGCLGRP